MNSNDLALINNALPISFDLEDTGEDLVATISLIYKRIANAVNGKESALYSLQEKGSLQSYFITLNPQQCRNVYRKCFDMVNLNGGVNIPAGGTVSFATNITG